MNTIKFPQLGEELYTHKAENGLNIYVVKRPGFTRKMAYFVTDFGSIHTDFQLDGETIHAPAGIAHFLEHKMFELPERDVSAEFSALGANVNAFTGYDMTAYYFSCTENFEKSLSLLLEFVSTPYFPEESVQRETGIIDQEIGMNEDSPDSRVFEDLMCAMYDHHPIRVPILGTRDSIRAITPAMLHKCHRAFYTPGNMVLCVVGDVEPETVCTIADHVLGTRECSVGIKLNTWAEEMVPKNALVRRKMEVSMPNFQLAFKAEPTEKGPESIRQEIIGDLAAEVLFGESSQLYLKLYEHGLIDSSFGGGFETIDGCAMLTCGGDSDAPETVRDAILSHAKAILHNGIDETDFLRMKRSAWGRRIRDLDSFDSTCFRICAYHFSQFSYFDFPEAYAQVTRVEILEFIHRVVTQERCALSVIDPKEEPTHE